MIDSGDEEDFFWRPEGRLEWCLVAGHSGVACDGATSELFGDGQPRKRSGQSQIGEDGGFFFLETGAEQ